jgi:tRNA threonylcarbamoyladenosine biosynthesis protein TsaE
MTRLAWRSAGEAATVRFGVVLGRALAGPAWIGLCGPLGAGKTRLAAGVARGLGYAGRVRSPSFVLERRYRGRCPILHLDLYRLAGDDDDLRAGWEEATEAVVLVEWAERVTEPPRNAFTVRIVPDGDTSRRIELEWRAGESPLGDLRLEALREGAEEAAEGDAAEGGGR